MKPAHPWSTMTAATYPVTGALGWIMRGTPESAVFAWAMLALGIATGWRHWTDTDRASTADQVSMHFVFAGLVLLAVGASWPVMAAGAVAAGVLLEWRFNLPLRPTFGAYAGVLIAALLARGQWLALAAFVVLAGGGLLIRDAGEREGQPAEDDFHSCWHSMSGIALLCAFLGL